MARASSGSPHLLRLQIQLHDYETVRTLHQYLYYLPYFLHRLISNDSCLLYCSIFFFLTDKRSRSRTKFHDVPESEIVESLANYGILHSMLPTAMGGTVQFSQSQWIAQRRAAEMEEL
jgi:hypothetical protein